MITVITLLRGSRKLTSRWSDAWKHCEKPEGSQLFIGANNEPDMDVATELNARAFPTEPFNFALHDEQARIQHVARIYEMIIPQVSTPYVLIWEDDILPPVDGITKLLAGIGDAAGIVSITPFHDGFVPQMAILFYAENPACVPVASLPKTGIDEVFGGGTAFSLWKTEKLAESLPWEIQVQENGFVPGWDWILAQKLKGVGKTLVELSIRCYHG